MPVIKTIQISTAKKPYKFVKGFVFVWFFLLIQNKGHKLLKLLSLNLIVLMQIHRFLSIKIRFLCKRVFSFRFHSKRMPDEQVSASSSEMKLNFQGQNNSLLSK